MKSTEKFEGREKRVDMHNFFIGKIEDAMKGKRYIEASWLIYSCFENRYFRTVDLERLKRSKSNVGIAEENVKKHLTNLR